MPVKYQVKVAGVWRDTDKYWVKVGGVWRVVDKAWAMDGGNWYQYWPTDDTEDPTEPPVIPPTGPAPGTYVLSPNTITISSSPGGLSWCRFNTGFYQGHISTVKARVSWKSGGSMGANALGNGSGTYYRNIPYDAQYSNRTIDHSLLGSSTSEFNAGSATGYTLDPDLSTRVPSDWINNLRLVIVV